MSRGEKLWVVSYDISDNKRRRRVAARLEDEMTRVQYSVFEGRLSVQRVDRLTDAITGMLGDGDSLRVYSIGKIGERRCRIEGDGLPIENGDGYWLL